LAGRTTVYPEDGQSLGRQDQPSGVTLYVDGLIWLNSCSNYDPISRACGGGSAVAYRTLAGAAAAAQAGDTVFFRQGTYNEQLRPLNSGASGSPITYRSYPGETAILSSGSTPATIVLQDVGYIAILDLRVEDARWLEALNAHDVVVSGNTFLRTPASGTTGNVRFISSDHNQILGNLLDDGNDNLVLIDSDFNLVEGNIIREGSHSLLSIRCSNYNVIRENYFSNTQQKIAEVYDCGTDTVAVPHAFNATHHNVIEGNVFAKTSYYYSTSGNNGIQYSGQDGILRRNVFYHTNTGLGMQIYNDEALYNEHNRVVQNVFYDNECAGIAVRGGALDNRYKNNILYKNKGISGDCYGTGPAQVVYRKPLAEFSFESNDILNEHPGEYVIQEEFGVGDTLVSYEAEYPALFAGNREIAPDFEDEAAFDFRLKSTSQLIDAGIYLAKATSSGSGTTLPVDDARYFTDGFGIQGMSGDLIRLEGVDGTATILSVDYDTNTLTLDTPLAWNEGQGVSLDYYGSAPDIGAYEFFPTDQFNYLPFLVK
jgi:hypothetical protein